MSYYNNLILFWHFPPFRRIETKHKSPRKAARKAQAAKVLEATEDLDLAKALGKDLAKVLEVCLTRVHEDPARVPQKLKWILGDVKTLRKARAA